MWRKWITLGVVVLFVGACADPKLQKQYYDVELQRTQAIIQSINAQSANQQKSMTLAMQSYSTSITAAAITPSPGDDIAIAMAWGFMLGRPQNITVPTLPPVQRPETNSDMIRAWTPLIGMALPFLYPLVWGNSSGGSGGNKYTADNGGSIVVDSGNPGSYNKIGGNQNLTNTQSDYSLIRNGDNCADCGLDEEFDDPFVCPDNPTVGKACDGCSCNSLLEGICSCDDLGIDPF